MSGEGTTDGVSLGVREGPFVPENKFRHLFTPENLLSSWYDPAIMNTVQPLGKPHWKLIKKSADLFLSPHGFNFVLYHVQPRTVSGGAGGGSFHNHYLTGAFRAAPLYSSNPGCAEMAFAKSNSMGLDPFVMVLKLFFRNK